MKTKKRLSVAKIGKDIECSVIEYLPLSTKENLILKKGNEVLFPGFDCSPENNIDVSNDNGECK